MGQAHASVENRTSARVVVITFNNADAMFTNYSNLYVLEPLQKMKVEASPDPVGLHVAIVYKVTEKHFHYKRWLCLNDAEMVVRSVIGEDIEVTGGTDF